MARVIKNSGRHARRKGHAFERWVAEQLRATFPDAQRQLEYQEHHCKGIDLSGTGCFKFQCKKLKNYASVATIEEIDCDEVVEGDVPVLVTAGDNKRAMAVLPFEHLLWLISKYEDNH